jgi:transcriptional regulator with XRE-family HTH domain
MRAMGRFTRRLRLLTGQSQAQLASRAGVSQAAVSRCESGRALKTPMIVNRRINLAMREQLALLPPALLSRQTRRLMEVPAVAPSPEGQTLGEAIGWFSRIRPAKREVVLDVLRVVAETAAGADTEANGRRPDVRVTASREPAGPGRALGATGTSSAELAAARSAELEAWMRGLGRTVRSLRWWPVSRSRSSP